MWFDSTATALSWMIFGHHLSWVFYYVTSHGQVSPKHTFFVGPQPQTDETTAKVAMKLETDLLLALGDFLLEKTKAIFPVNLLVSCCWHSWMAKASRCGAPQHSCGMGGRCLEGGDARVPGAWEEHWGFANLDQVSWLIVVFFFVDFMSHFWLHSGS